MRNVFFILLIFGLHQGFAQNIDIQVFPVFGNDILEEEKWFVTAQGDSIQIENVRFYLSDIQLEMKDGRVVKDQNTAHLVDVFEPSTLHFGIENKNFGQIKKIRFNIGIDSLASVSGALSGDLDPSKGMYWAWQSGYINTMIKGQFTLSSKPLKEFEFHLGGFMAPFNAYQRVSLPACSHDKLTIQWDLDSWFSSPVFIQHDRIMSPRIEAVQMSEFLASQFSCR